MTAFNDQRQEFRRTSDRALEHLDLARTRVSWAVVAWIIGVLATCLVTYFAASNTVNARVSVLESRQQGTEKRLEEMTRYLEALNSKMDQILLNSAKR